MIEIGNKESKMADVFCKDTACPMTTEPPFVNMRVSQALAVANEHDTRAGSHESIVLYHDGEHRVSSADAAKFKQLTGISLNL